MGKDLKGTDWTANVTEDGVRQVTCTSWGGFVNFLTNTLIDYRNYVFRGHEKASWKLESTLDRALAAHAGRRPAPTRESHLESFKYATRGRRGSSPPALKDENDWWALGQHHGLATPLLDWSESPFVAAYFAFYKNEGDLINQEDRVVFALSRTSVEAKCKSLQKAAGKDDKSTGIISFVRPMSDDNPRLITQRGLFTRSPDGVDIESWISTHFEGETGGAKLLKIIVPTRERDLAMKSLNRMNINHLSLFPDLYGAAKYCNFELSIKKY